METELLNFAGSGILGGLLGGVFRLAPEVLKFFDRKNERTHELNMFKEQCELTKLQGELKIEEKYVDYSVAQLQAIQAATEAEASAAAKSYKWVGALSAIVRPTISLTMFLFYIIVKSTFVINGFHMGMDWNTIVGQTWTENDFMILMMILTFHYVGRPLEKYQSNRV